MNQKKQRLKHKEKYYFFLNPYVDCAFTRCPKCDNTTKIRKIPLAIHLELGPTLLFVNTTCRYCPYCDLVIIKQQEIESMIKQFQNREKLEEDDYFVFGTQDKTLWRKGIDKKASPQELLNGLTVFKNKLNFYTQPGQWYLAKRGDRNGRRWR